MAVCVQAGKRGWNGWADTNGGTDGRVIRVTNLESEGPGSLRAALNADGKRLVVFDVGGVIDLQAQELHIDNPHITIAGQTAPSPGITVIKSGLVIRTHDVIVQHLPVRVGEEGWDKEGGETAGMDAITVRVSGDEKSDIIVDHCSATWAVDENLSAEADGSGHAGIKFSNNIVAEPLRPHPAGSLIGTGTR